MRPLPWTGRDEHAQILLLGAIAGVTILLGLPAGRVQTADLRLKAGLSAMATGILLFLLWDVLSHAVEPVEASLTAAVDGTGGWGRFVRLASLLAVGVGGSLMALVYYDQWLTRRRAVLATRSSRLSDGAQLAVMIATGIGLHNFAEGLAIGQSAASGETSLAIVLVVGIRTPQRDRGVRDRRADVGRVATAVTGRSSSCSARSVADRPSSGRSSARPGRATPSRLPSLRSQAGRSSTSSSSYSTSTARST